MHADALTHLGARERAERLDTLLEEILLAIDDDIGDASDRLPPLVDVVDEELRARDVLADVLTLVVGHRWCGGAGAPRGLKLSDELTIDRVHAERESPRLDDLDLEVALLVPEDDHIGPECDLPAADARAVGARSEGVSRIRVEALLHPIPVLLDVLAADAQGLGDVAEFVLAELAKVVGDDRTHVCRDLLANLGEVVDLDQQALAGVASADAPRLDALDRR